MCISVVSRVYTYDCQRDQEGLMLNPNTVNFRHGLIQKLSVCFLFIALSIMGIVSEIP